MIYYILLLCALVSNGLVLVNMFLDIKQNKKTPMRLYLVQVFCAALCWFAFLIFSK